MKWYFYGALVTAISLHGSYLTPQERVTGAALWPVTVAAAFYSQVKTSAEEQ